MQNKTKTKIIFLGLLSLFIWSCDNNKSDLSELEKKLDTILKEKNIDINRTINADDAQTVAIEEELIEITTLVIERISRGKVEEGFQVLKKHSPLPAEEFQKIKEQTLKQFKMIKPRFGEFIGYEFINSEKIGKSIIRHDCIVKCQNHIIRWEFFYYKPEDKWFLNTFKWDDRIQLIKNG